MTKALILSLITSLLIALGGCWNDTPYTAATVALTVNLIGQGEVIIEDFRGPFYPRVAKLLFGLPTL